MEHVQRIKKPSPPAILTASSSSSSSSSTAHSWRRRSARDSPSFLLRVGISRDVEVPRRVRHEQELARVVELEGGDGVRGDGVVLG